MKARAAWLVFGGIGYVLALFLVVQVATANGFMAGLGLPAGTVRTGAYDSRGLEVAAVDPDQIAGSVGEASGGPPTIASPPPETPAKGDPDAASSQPPPRATGTNQKPAPAGGAPNQTTPTTIAAFIASLPPSWQSSIQAALQKTRSPDN